MHNKDLLPIAQPAARAWLAIFIFGAWLLGLLCFAAQIFVPIPYGDLTRIGRVSEKLFGWMSIQPNIQESNRKNYPLDSADVLVVGDSFSMPMAWQSVLQKKGLRVHTTTWDRVTGVCADFPAWLANNGFNGRFVIFESIERYFANRLVRSLQCGATKPQILPMTATKLVQPNFWLDLGGSSPFDAYEIWNRTKRVKDAKASIILTNPPGNRSMLVSAIKVSSGCTQFSHNFCNAALFLNEDFTTPILTKGDASTMSQISNVIHSAKVIWMIIPNKYTVYVDPSRGDEFPRALNDLHLGPDLFRAAQTDRWQIKDLYWPNDTHWSTIGQVHFGRIVLNWIER